MLDGDIVTFLRADSTITSDFSTRIYTGVTPDNPTLPCAVVRTVTSQRNGRPEIRSARVQISNYANTYSDAMTHAEHINTRLHSYFGAMGSTQVLGCWCETQTPLYDTTLKKNYIVSDYIIKTR